MVIRLLAAALVAIAGCDKSRTFHIEIAPACNQPALDLPLDDVAAPATMEIRVAQLGGPDAGTAAFDLTKGGGSFDGVPEAPGVWVEVVGHGGANAEAVVAGTTGYLDLSRSGRRREFRLDLVVGRVGHFMRTTALAEPTRCTAPSQVRRGQSAAAGANGSVVLFGGAVDASDPVMPAEAVEAYDPLSGEFAQTGTIPTPRFNHSTTITADGRYVVLLGGLAPIDTDGDPDTPPELVTLDTGSVFDTETGSFLDQLIQLSSPRMAHQATPLADGRIVISGGCRRVKPSCDPVVPIEIFDTRNIGAVGLATVPGPTLEHGRADHAVAVLPEDVLVMVGGRDDNGLVAEIEFATIGPSGFADSFVLPGPNMEVPRTHPLVHVVDQDVVVAGGVSDLDTDPDVGLATDRIDRLRYNPALPSTSSFVCGDGALPAPRARAGAITTPRGLMLVGGLDEQGGPRNDAVVVHLDQISECQLPHTSIPGSMAQGRVAPSLVRMLGGDVMVVGGYDVLDGYIVGILEPEVFVWGRAAVE